MLMASDEGKYGLVASFLVAAGMTIYHVGMKVLATKRGRKMARAALDLDTSTDEMTPIKKDVPNEKLTDALLQFVHRMEEGSQADRQERGRQWDKIGETIDEIRSQADATRDQAEATRGVIRTMQEMIDCFKESNEQHSKQLDQLLDNQISLSAYIRDTYNQASGNPPAPFKRLKGG